MLFLKNTHRAYIIVRNTRTEYPVFPLFLYTIHTLIRPKYTYFTHYMYCMCNTIALCSITSPVRQFKLFAENLPRVSLLPVFYMPVSGFSLDTGASLLLRYLPDP